MVSPIRLASIGPSTVLTVAIVLPPLTRFHSIDLYPTPLPSVPVKLEALPLKAIFKSAKRPGPFLVPGFRLDPTSSLGLLILLGFLSFLHFFDAAEWTAPVMKRTKGIMRINRLKWTKKTMARLLVYLCHEHIRTYRAPPEYRS